MKTRLHCLGSVQRMASSQDLKEFDLTADPRTVPDDRKDKTQGRRGGRWTGVTYKPWEGLDELIKKNWKTGIKEKIR